MSNTEEPTPRVDGQVAASPGNSHESTETDTARAATLLRRRWRERLNDEDAAWLQQYSETHDSPIEDYSCTGRVYAQDLGMNLDGRRVDGTPFSIGYGRGNVNVAGGWHWRLSDLENRGWHHGYLIEVLGLTAALEALELPAPAAVDEPIHIPIEPHGPVFLQELHAYESLANRLLATLILLTDAALRLSGKADKIIERQQAAYRAGVDSFLADYLATPNTTPAAPES